MKVHLRQIPADGLHFEGEEPCPLADLGQEEVKCAGPLTYSIDVGISEDSLWANGTLSQPVELGCVSCLRRFEHTIEVPGFALHMELGGPELVDLTPAVREDLLLNLPPYPRCDRDGGLVCEGPLPIASSPAEPVKEKTNWGALDKLDL